MAMSKKHYESVAGVIGHIVRLAQNESPVRRNAKLEAAKEMAEGMASMFAADNGRFDHRTFMAACGFGTHPTEVKKRERFWLYGERVQIVAVDPLNGEITVRHAYGVEVTGVRLRDLCF